MTTTITDGATTVTPDLALGYQTATNSANKLHQIVGVSSPDYSLASDTPRVGSLSLFFLDRADAWAALALLMTAAVFHLEDTDLPLANMAFVRADQMTLALDSQTSVRWILTVGYQEIIL